jgi:molybdopterin-guanine dinucleotide biosynthesis protein A
MIEHIPCVILCGGKSSRMGEDKALLPFKNSNSLLEYQYNRLKNVFSNVYISSKTNKIDFTSNIILDNNQEISSPMIALESIFESLEEKKVFIITVDTPFVSKQTIENIINNSQNHEITIAKTNGDNTHNLCGVFARNLQKKINQYIQKDIHKIGLLLKESNTKIIDCDNEDEFLYNYFKKGERFGRLLNQKAYGDLQDMFFHSQTKTAQQRFDEFINKTPYLLDKVPQYHIASYLGISPQHLSRLKKEYQK